MYKKILCATDGSGSAAQAERHAGSLAKSLGAQLTFVTIAAPPPTFAQAEIGMSLPASIYEDLEKESVARTSAILDAARGRCGYQASTIRLVADRAYEAILDAAAQADADLIVMGSHGHRGFERLLLGSQAAKVLALSICPVLIVKGTLVEKRAEVDIV